MHLRILEHEPLEALQLLTRDEVDLVLTYDYNLAPALADPTVETRPCGRCDWGLGVPSTRRRAPSTHENAVRTSTARRVDRELPQHR